ncbi:MAG TPA: PKD domain-containing protein [Candidatus Acidoferrales bacterium]|nr:PKD domain-containing protein [Candidatus Acidoferrales bacterium]
MLVLILANNVFAQDVFMFVAGREAPVTIRGDAVHSYDFIIKPPPRSVSSELEIYDASLGGVADVFYKGRAMETTYQLYTYRNGRADRMMKTLTVAKDARYINRWTDFDSLDPAGSPEGWLLRVSAGHGRESNSFKLRVRGSSSDSSEHKWEIYALNLPVCLYKVPIGDEVQFRPVSDKTDDIRQLSFAGGEGAVVYMKDEFGRSFRLSRGSISFDSSAGDLGNRWGIAVGGSHLRINNVVVKGNSPLLWRWKPVIVGRVAPRKVSAKQLPGNDCLSARFALSGETKRQVVKSEPIWVLAKTTIEGDSSIISFVHAGTYSGKVFLPTTGMYFPKYWVGDFTARIIAPPDPKISLPKRILSPGETIVLTAKESQEDIIAAYRWYVNNEYRGSKPSLLFSSLLPGKYVVRLIEKNSSLSSKCNEASTTEELRVNSRPYVEINAPKVIAHSMPVKFLASNASDSDGDSLIYSWSGTGIVSPHDQPSISLTHEKPGNYRISLTVSDQTGTANSDYTATFSYRVDADPVPMFSLPTMAAPGDEISLSALDSRDPDDSNLKFHWEVSNGMNFSGPTAKFSFAQPGDYVVKLTADDGQGVANSVQSTEHKIHIDAPVVPIITAADSSNLSRQNFSGSKTKSADSAGVSYAWDFGDGSKGVGESVTHVFQTGGKFTITLTVDDGKKQSNSVQNATHVIVINKNPIAEFSLPSEWEPGKTLRVSGTRSYDPDGIVTGYTWIVNGNTVGHDSIAALVFPEPGDYAVALKVKDNSGFEDAAGLKTARIHVNYPPVIKWEMTPKVAEPGEVVTFDSKGTSDPDGEIKSVVWNFSDGTSAEGAVVKKAFKESGVVVCKITVNDGEGFENSAQTEEFSLLVNSPPIIVTRDLIRTNSRIVNLDASKSYDIDGQALKFEWLLPDGTRRYESTFNWEAPGGGIHFLTLTVDDGQGKKNSIARETIRVIVNRPPVAVVDSIIYSCSGRTVLFNGSRSYDPDKDPLIAEWKFGDGTTSAEINPVHTYTEPGYYEARLIISDGFAEKPSVATLPVIIEGSPQAVQDFSDTTVCLNTPIEFDGTRSSDPNGPIGSFAWNFGDGTTAFGRKVSHAYSKTGTYRAELTVIGNGSGRCSRVSQATSTVRVVEGPVAMFSIPQAVSVGEYITTDASGSKTEGKVLSTDWSIRSKDTSFTIEGSRADFIPRSPGKYDVTLTIVLETAASCGTATLTRTVVVNAPPVLRWNVPDAVALGDLLTMDATASTDPDGVIINYNWKFDGKTVATTPVASMVMVAPGNHILSLLITDNSGTSSRSVYKEMTVFVNSKPNPDFSLPDKLYEGEIVHLVPARFTDADGDSLSFVWKMDGIENDPSGLHLTIPGKHAITLIANDGRQMSNSVDSVSKEIFVTLKPDLNSVNFQKDWIAGSEVEISNITSLPQVGFVTDSGFMSRTKVGSAGKQIIVLAWNPQGTILEKEQFDIEVWPSLEFKNVPAPVNTEWNPSNPTKVLNAPDVNRPDSRNVRYEWRKGGVVVGYGKIVSVPLTKGENVFSVTATDQDMVGARPVTVNVVVACQ